MIYSDPPLLVDIQDVLYVDLCAVRNNADPNLFTHMSWLLNTGFLSFRRPMLDFFVHINLSSTYTKWTVNLEEETGTVYYISSQTFCIALW